MKKTSGIWNNFLRFGMEKGILGLKMKLMGLNLK